MNAKFFFPALVIGESSIDKIDYKLLVCDKRFISKAYKNVLIVDTVGNAFETQGVKQIGGLSLFYSLKLFGLLVEVEPILKKPVYKMGIDDFKNRIISVIGGNPRRFSNLSDKSALIDEVKDRKSFKEVINVF